MDSKTRDFVKNTIGQQAWWPSLMPSSRWVRVRLGNELIAESRNPMLVLQYGRPPRLPTYYFGPDEVNQANLVGRVDNADGSATWDVESDGRRAQSSAWTHPDPTGELEPLAGMLTFDWWGELDWYEEEEKVFAHARDPFKRVDVVSSSRHVEVYVDDTKLAESNRPTLLFETYLPIRYYLPPEDVSLGLLAPSETITMCPYKGVSRHWSFAGTDIAWAYPDPVPENPRIEGLVSFYNERVDLVVDGDLQERPRSPWEL